MTQHYDTGEAVTRAFFDAWNAQDLELLASLFVEDADFVNVVGFWWTSRRQIRKAHDYGFREIFQEARVEIIAIKLRALGADVEVVHTVSTLDGQNNEHDVTAAQRVGGSYRRLSRIAVPWSLKLDIRPRRRRHHRRSIDGPHLSQGHLHRV